MSRLFYAVAVAACVVTWGGLAHAQDDLLDDLAAEPAEPKDDDDDDDLSAPLDDLDDDLDAPLEEVEAAPAAGAKPPEEKEEEVTETDPSKLDKVKSVPRKRIIKKNRVEIAPFFSLSLNDSFYQHLAISASVVFYPHDNFGIGLGGSWMFVRAGTGNLEVVREGLTSVPAVIDPPTLFAHLDLYWLPIYGKLSLFENYIVHFDLYGVIGFGVATALNGEAPPMATAGIGQRFVVSDWLAFRLELRDYLYVDQQLVNNQPRSDIQNFLMLQVGFSFYIPPSFEYTLL